MKSSSSALFLRSSTASLLQGRQAALRLPFDSAEKSYNRLGQACQLRGVRWLYTSGQSSLSEGNRLLKGQPDVAHSPLSDTQRDQRLFRCVLVANRGAIACRVIRTLKRLGIRSVAVYSDADVDSLHVLEADEAVNIGPGPATQSYLDGDKIIAIARQVGAEAIHPGYGFLSENADFAAACARAGLTFIGPTPQQMRDFGLKHTARNLAKKSGVPMLPGSDLLEDVEHAKREAARIGYPVMLKSTAGGGGIGMKLCNDERALVDAFESVRRLAASAFKHNGLFLEKFVLVARHLEVQIFGDGKGNVVALGERDCSAQRRNQKVLEETPAPGISAELRRTLLDAAERLAASVGYASAGTVEFLFDVASLQFYFLEVNTVEHGVTEQVTGIDLVEWMVKAAAGVLDLSNFVRPEPVGWSIQARVYAEDPNKDFQPSSGLLTEVEFPPTDAHVRVEAWISRGATLSPFYDPMIAKVIATGSSRADALARLESALQRTRIGGIANNVAYLQQILRSTDFASGAIHLRWLASFRYETQAVDVLEPGTQTSVQDFPGRTGYWSIGVPPSGPMDDYAHRLANALVHNAQDAAALEIALSGPTLRFNADTSIALTGAEFEADIDGNPVPWWRTIHVRAGAVLRIGAVKAAGCRCVLAIRGGFDTPRYLGSRSTFALGNFGGHGGRNLRHGDVLPVGASDATAAFVPIRRAPAALIPQMSSRWEVAVTLGPHAAPDFFTPAFMETLFGSDYEVHYNSNRLGIRLVGPKPQFSRTDGGEAGLHPSNIHDNEYAIGTINFTGEMPVILAKDGPSLGGFVCPVTIISSELWKIGQLRPGAKIRFVPTTFDAALQRERLVDAAVAFWERKEQPETFRELWTLPSVGQDSAVLQSIPATPRSLAVTHRAQGDKNILVEYGALELDLNSRFRVHALTQWLESRRASLPGLGELSPGVRSLQVQFDGRLLARAQLLQELARAEEQMGDSENLTLPSRLVRLPFAFKASTTLKAIAKYQESVRDKAPWLPSNVEFIRRINGLESEEDVKQTLFRAQYMVLGLGDVYLGAPCAVPLDPRHRLQTTKYNPARTWTAEGEVGIGGVYMCIYGMESPGGYQLVGRTPPVWSTYKVTPDFKDGKPWLLRYFDVVQFYPVEEDELNAIRRDLARGVRVHDIKEQPFSPKTYRAFLESNAVEIAAFKARQSKAFEEERRRWDADGSAKYDTSTTTSPTEAPEILAPGNIAVPSPIAGSVRQVLVKAGDRVEQGQRIAVVEAMKTEVFLVAPSSGQVSVVARRPGQIVSAGESLIALAPSAMA